MTPTPLICLAHRGGGGRAPENTLAAVRNAIRLGADWIEIDVHCVDGALIVIHDDTLDRTTNGTGPIASRSLDDLRRLDAGGGERIPLLAEVLDLIESPVGINIELKGLQTAVPVVEMVGTYLDARKLNPEQILVSSFDHRQLQTARRLAPDLNLGVLFSGRHPVDPALAGRLDAVSVHLSRKLATCERIADLHRRGFRVYVYTVNALPDILDMQRMGVDGVFSDYPDRVIGLRKGSG